jgi:hypothetical protein
MTGKMYSRLDLPSPDYKIEIFSDGYEEYEKCFANYYANTCINYGQVIKIREGGKVVDKFRSYAFDRKIFIYIVIIILLY